MRTSTIVGVIIVIAIAAGAWFYMNMNGSWSMSQDTASTTQDNSAAGTVLEGSQAGQAGAQVDASDNPTAAPSPSPAAAPSGAAGVKGSTNQGNTGGATTGVVQQPGADGAEGSIIGSNLALGTDSTETLGKYLIAYNGMTLYLYTKDTGKESTCYGQCASNWPPYLVGAEDNVTNVKAGVNADMVGTVMRTDGTIQVTYDGHPLYFWKNDTHSGDTTGQGVGEVWFVVKP